MTLMSIKRSKNSNPSKKPNWIKKVNRFCCFQSFSIEFEQIRSLFDQFQTFRKNPKPNLLYRIDPSWNFDSWFSWGLWLFQPRLAFCINIFMNQHLSHNTKDWTIGCVLYTFTSILWTRPCGIWTAVPRDFELTIDPTRH